MTEKCEEELTELIRDIKNLSEKIEAITIQDSVYANKGHLYDSHIIHHLGKYFWTIHTIGWYNYFLKKNNKLFLLKDYKDCLQRFLKHKKDNNIYYREKQCSHTIIL